MKYQPFSPSFGVTEIVGYEYPGADVNSQAFILATRPNKREEGLVAACLEAIMGVIRSRPDQMPQLLITSCAQF